MLRYVLSDFPPGAILFAQKNRTSKWLRVNGLQLPVHVTKYGSIDSIFGIGYSVNNDHFFLDSVRMASLRILRRIRSLTSGSSGKSIFSTSFSISAASAMNASCISSTSDLRLFLNNFNLSSPLIKLYHERGKKESGK